MSSQKTGFLLVTNFLKILFFKWLLNDSSWDLPLSHWIKQGASYPQIPLDLESIEWHAYIRKITVLVKVSSWQVRFPYLPYQPMHNFSYLNNSIQCYKTFASPELHWVFVFISCMKEHCQLLHISPKICHENLFYLKVASRTCAGF